MENILIFILSGSIIFVITLSLLVIKHYRKQQRQLREFAADLGGDDLKSGVAYEGESEGLKYNYQYYPGSKNSPAYFKLSIDCPSRGEFEIKKESRFDSFFKRLGLTVEIQTGDSDFDRQYYIQTDSVEFTRLYLMSPEKRAALKKLFALGYTHLSHDGDNIEAKISPFSLPSFKGRDYLEATLKELRQLSRDIPEETAGYRVAGAPVWKFKRNFIYTVSIVSIIAGVALLFWANRIYPPLDGVEMLLYSLDYIVPAFILFTVLAVIYLKGRSSSHKDLLINLAIALFGFPLSGYFGVMAINGHTDPFASTDHAVLVLNKHYTQSKNSKNYYITTKSWRNGRADEKIRVFSDFYQKVDPGKTVLVITTKPGRLGFEWVVSFEISR